MSDALALTLGNVDWVKDNERKLQRIFPEIWTHPGNINPLKLLFDLKLAGVDYRTDDEAAWALAFLTKVGICQVQPGTLCMRRNPHSIFPKDM